MVVYDATTTHMRVRLRRERYPYPLPGCRRCCKKCPPPYTSQPLPLPPPYIPSPYCPQHFCPGGECLRVMPLCFPYSLLVCLTLLFPYPCHHAFHFLTLPLPISFIPCHPCITFLSTLPFPAYFLISYLALPILTFSLLSFSQFCHTSFPPSLPTPLTLSINLYPTRPLYPHYRSMHYRHTCRHTPASHASPYTHRHARAQCYPPIHAPRLPSSQKLGYT